MSETITGMLVFLVILGVLFLILREFMCWYWKINQSVSLLEEIRDLLLEQRKPSLDLSEKMTEKNTKNAANYEKASPTSAWTCPKCGEYHDSQYSACWKCGFER